MKAILIGKTEITKELAKFKFKLDEKINFKPGQFITFDIILGNKRILRPYSISSSPSKLPEIELFIKKITDKGKGIFTDYLFNCEKGTEINVLSCAGIFTLKDDKRIKILVGSGTGISPYMSMIRSELERKNKANFVVIHGVSYVKHLAYGKELEKYEKEKKIIKYIPTVSRPKENNGWKKEVGRAEELVKEKLSNIINEDLNPKKHLFYLCGHPEIIDNVSVFLSSLGFTKNDIITEKYWFLDRAKNLNS